MIYLLILKFFDKFWLVNFVKSLKSFVLPSQNVQKRELLSRIWAYFQLWDRKLTIWLKTFKICQKSHEISLNFQNVQKKLFKTHIKFHFWPFRLNSCFFYSSSSNFKPFNMSITILSLSLPLLPQSFPF